VRICKFVFLLVLICGNTMAQSPASIHIQSELPKQYSVEWNGKTYQSSETGYLVIPEVPAGDQLLFLGFPGNAYPETAFTCSIGDKSRGFSLKLGLDDSWTLFDMVDLYATKGAPAAGLKLAKLATPAAANPSAAPKPGPKTSPIRKLFDKAGPDGIDQVYLIDNNGKTDTVALFIPVLEEARPRQSAFMELQPSNDTYLSIRHLGSLRFAVLNPGNHTSIPGQAAPSPYNDPRSNPRNRMLILHPRGIFA
jgi:hypothetical protein